MNKTRIYTDKEIRVLSSNPNVVRIVFTVNKQSDLSKFKTYTNGTDIVVKYNSSIIDNSIQYNMLTAQQLSDDV